jgi:hypothetical protein
LGPRMVPKSEPPSDGRVHRGCVHNANDSPILSGSGIGSGRLNVRRHRSPNQGRKPPVFDRFATQTGGIGPAVGPVITTWCNARDWRLRTEEQPAPRQVIPLPCRFTRPVFIDLRFAGALLANCDSVGNGIGGGWHFFEYG